MYKPTNKNVIKYYCRDDFSPGLTEDGYNFWDMCHVGKIKYGVWHTGGEQEDL